MVRLALIWSFLCVGICTTSAQIIDFSGVFSSKKVKAFSQQLQYRQDSLKQVCYANNLNERRYDFPTFSEYDGMGSLKKKAKKLEEIKIMIEKDIARYELEEKKNDSIQRVQDSLYLIRAAKTWEWLNDGKGEWKTIDRSYPKEEHYQVNSLFPQYKVINGNAYLDGKFVAIGNPIRGDKYEFREIVIKFLCQQDFLNNKYDIQTSSSPTKEYIKWQLGLREKPSPVKEAASKENAKKLRIAQQRLQAGEISQDTYNRLKAKLSSGGTKTQPVIAEVGSPEREEGERYLKQLRNDYYSIMYQCSIQRIDGTNFIYQYQDINNKDTLSVQVSYHIDEKNVIQCKFSTLQKK